MQATAGPQAMHVGAFECYEDDHKLGQQDMVTDDLRCGLFEPADEPARPGNDIYHSFLTLNFSRCMSMSC